MMDEAAIAERIFRHVEPSQPAPVNEWGCVRNLRGPGFVHNGCPWSLAHPDKPKPVVLPWGTTLADPALAALQNVLDDLYPAFVAWVDDGAPEPPGTALMAALAAQGYVLAPAERVLVGAGQVAEE